MLKGAQKRMIVIRTRDSRLFEEAYFVMRRDLPETDIHSRDMLQEANHLIDCSLASSALSPLPASPSKRFKHRSVWWFLAGTALGGLCTGTFFLFLPL